MKKTTRREFIQTGAAGLAGLAVFSRGMKGFGFSPAPDTIDMVKLGNTGLIVPRVAIGQDQEDGRMLQTRPGSA